ncbi:MAG: thioredoxin [Lachnospiraceae bacterium]|jgi:thioredoxin 1|nr:thioredoxin [Lachnospiraceae bacterium]
MRFDSTNFDDEVINSSLPVMVDFYADWCGPCKMMAPVVDEMAEKYSGKIKIGQVNVDDNPDLASRYNVMSIPTFLFLREGKVVDTAIGGIPKAALEDHLKKLL